MLPVHPVTKAELKKAAAKSYPRTHFAKGMYFKGKGQIDQALIEFLKASQENPRTVRAFYEQALIFRQRHFLKLAESSLEQALTVKPDYQEARILLATIRIEQGNVGGAFEELSKSLGLQASGAKQGANKRTAGDTAKPQDILAKAPAVLQSLHTFLADIPNRFVLPPFAADQRTSARTQSDPASRMHVTDTKISLEFKKDDAVIRVKQSSTSDTNANNKSTNARLNESSDTPTKLAADSTHAVETKIPDSTVSNAPDGNAKQLVEKQNSTNTDVAASNESSESVKTESSRKKKRSKLSRRPKGATEQDRKNERESLEIDAIIRAQQSATQSASKASVSSTAAGATYKTSPDTSGTSADTSAKEVSRTDTVEVSTKQIKGVIDSSAESVHKLVDRIPFSWKKLRTLHNKKQEDQAAVEETIKELAGSSPSKATFVAKQTSTDNTANTIDAPETKAFEPARVYSTVDGAGEKQKTVTFEPADQTESPSDIRPFRMPQIASASSMLAPVKGQTDQAAGDEWTIRLKYLAEHGTATLKQGEAFMFAEDTGEATLFLPDGQAIRRQIAIARDANEVVRERRPDILVPEDLMYNLQLLGKLVPKFDTTPQTTTDRLDSVNSPGPNFSFNGLLDHSDGIWGWFKNVFKIAN